MTDEHAESLSLTSVADITGSFFKRNLLKKLTQLTQGRLTLIDRSERYRFGSARHDEDLHAEVRVLDPETYQRMALGGSVGVAEAYMDGAWEVDDLTALVRIFVRNRDVLDGMESGIARFATGALKLWHQWRRNSKSGSRRNIAAHYDLGNDFFELFLDPTLMYSSAIYADEAETLEAAQQRKLDRICRKLDLKPGESLVEIGTGWGGFALHAAKHYGVQVTTTTISQRQHDLAKNRIHAEGLQDRVTLLLRDYRELEGKYDKLVSIEMIEAVGHQYLDTYFAKVSALLKNDGLGLIQAITIEDHRYRQALKEVDFIKRHIFPGSFIPSVSAMVGSFASVSDLRLINLEDFGASYALTLKAWRERFLQRLSQVRLQGYSDAFSRMWHYYFAYCEGGFLERSISDVHMLLAKPGNKRSQFLPDLKSRI